ncbi:MAG: YceD family protein [Jiangellaceae bacterium]
MRRVGVTVPAPAGLGLGGVVGVPEGADLELDLRLESVMEGVLVSGAARAPLAGECVRCLDPVEDDLDVEIQELYAYPDHGVPDGEDDELMVEDHLLDLEPAIRDAVVLALPQAPLCRDDCPGLCPQCGARLADDPTHTHDTTDPRWAALTGLLADRTVNTSAETGSTRAGPTEER